MYYLCYINHAQFLFSFFFLQIIFSNGWTPIKECCSNWKVLVVYFFIIVIYIFLLVARVPLGFLVNGLHLSLLLSICRDVQREGKKCRIAVRTFPLTSKMPDRSFVTNVSLELPFFSPLYLYPCIWFIWVVFIFRISISIYFVVNCKWMSFFFDRHWFADLVLCRQILCRRSMQTRRRTDQVSPPTLHFFPSL